MALWDNFRTPVRVYSMYRDTISLAQSCFKRYADQLVNKGALQEAAEYVSVPQIATSAKPRGFAFPGVFFEPKPLTAVIGASSRKFNTGRLLLDKLQRQRIPSFAISDSTIPGVQCFARQSAPRPDLLLIATPASSVQQILDDYTALPKIVYSAGFDDCGAVALRGQNFVGPNSAGVVGINDYTLLAQLFGKQKKFGIVSSSGAVLGVLAGYGGAGFSVGNQTAFTQRDAAEELSKRFRTVAIYCESDDFGLIDVIKKHQSGSDKVRYKVLLGGATQAGRQRAKQHTGRCLSEGFVAALSQCEGVRMCRSLDQLVAQVYLQDAAFVPVVQSGYCATRIADLLPAKQLTAGEQRQIASILEREKVPVKVHNIVDVTPSLSADGIVRIVTELLKDPGNGVLLSVLGDLSEKGELLDRAGELAQYKNRLVLSVENDQQTAAAFAQLGFLAFSSVDAACAALQ